MSRERRAPMSLESAMDEERREVMNMLEGRPAQPASPAPRRDRTASPAPIIRSMLDVSSPTSRHSSIAGIGGGITAPPSRPTPTTVQSMLDPTSPPPTKPSHTTVASPVTETTPVPERHRSSSDAPNIPPEGLRKIVNKYGVNIDQDYQFDMLPSIASQALPKRVAQGGKPMLSSSAMAAAISGELSRGSENKQGSASGIGSKSKSPSSRPSGRSQSPGLNAASFNPSMTTPGKYMTDSGKAIDMTKAYRRLSEPAFRKFGSSLASDRKGSTGHASRGDGNSASPDESTRLTMDDALGDHAVAESSDEDVVSTEDEELKSEASRGRRRSRRKKSAGSSEGDWEDDETDKGALSLETTIGMGRGKGPKKVKSLLAAAEEERLKVVAHSDAKSVAEPTFSLTSPAGEKMVPKRSGVHPSTSFDYSGSGCNSENTSDNEADMSDIKRAQKMSINMSHVDTTVRNRVIRTILRGDFAEMEKEAEEGLRRQRLYLVATDLSDEAVYALEWTIGTILRDGDTLFAMYAVDEEIGTGKAGEAEKNHKDQIGEGTRVAQEAVDSLAALTERARINPVPNPSPLVPHGYLPATESNSRGASVDSRMMSKSDTERSHAIDDISQTCVRLLRKTRLQVRVAIEVIHCKSPKHLITEAIDTLNPTLVILGSRGRSALKGVLLGSFSNYLVTKSSVPVMVARKKLRKHAKYKPGVGAGGSLRLSNNLSTQKRVGGRALADAKID